MVPLPLTSKLPPSMIETLAEVVAPTEVTDCKFGVDTPPSK